MTEAAGGTTNGRYLVLLEDHSGDAGIRTMADVAGLRPANTADLAGTTLSDLTAEVDGVLLYDLGVVLITAAPDQVEALDRATRERGPIARVEPERTVHAISPAAPAAEQAGMDESTLTWGLQAVGVTESDATGAGIRVAVLDTGFDVDHPDFARRTVVTRSFIPGEDIADGHGHGTHCIGTACGPREPAEGPGYGIAHESEIYAGKVLSNAGSGTDGGILAGISWAIAHGCTVVSMSLGAPTRPGDPHSPIFERAARRALQRGTLIVAAAGNDSRRAQDHIAPVGHPANCPSVLAVGAVDARDGIADFSCGTVDLAGAVDLIGPGVDVYSSWPMPDRQHTISGTSMATPHVSGVAALIAQRYGGGGLELWARLSQTAHRSALPSTDVGAGLVRAPGAEG
ncbi:S8 family serine peptidase [Amycolatopsis cihanbeyliensis]|uniref:Subtilase family protein n=1 Tax=Amycolatopsis cihanbeyliensis TaxID=1128664 RepID=A0A542DCH8_AMYCI|nr:S8 family serine peptidase [Amycolatopsis cihanbeyliensis]TQJ00767.1 subtilase family protein [Amycolatopsis cihanbeyliensis]